MVQESSIRADSGLEALFTSSRAQYDMSGDEHSAFLGSCQSACIREPKDMQGLQIRLLNYSQGLAKMRHDGCKAEDKQPYLLKPQALGVGAPASGHKYSIHARQGHLLAFRILGHNCQVTVGVFLDLLGTEGGVHVDTLPLILCLHMLSALHVKTCIKVAGQIEVKPVKTPNGDSHVISTGLPSYTVQCFCCHLIFVVFMPKFCIWLQVKTRLHAGIQGSERICAAALAPGPQCVVYSSY